MKTVLGLFLLFIVTFSAFFVFFIKERGKKGEPLKSPNPVITKIENEQTTDSSKIEQLVQKDLDNYHTTTGDNDAHFSVYIETLPSTSSAKLVAERYKYNENEKMYSASLYKLIVIAAIMKEIDQGNLNLDTVISESKDQLASEYGQLDYGYENAPATISYTVEQALEKVSQYSDNFATIMLTDKLWQIEQPGPGDDLLADEAVELNMADTDFSGDYITTTASDIANYFRLLYYRQVVSPQASDHILYLLTQNKINDRIPDQLPSDVAVAHKTGELATVKHDAGIVFLGNKPYLVVLMSSNFDNVNPVIDMMSNMSKDVFDYFSNETSATQT